MYHIFEDQSIALTLRTAAADAAMSYATAMARSKMLTAADSSLKHQDAKQELRDAQTNVQYCVRMALEGRTSRAQTL